MSHAYTDEAREEAAMICSLAACNDDLAELYAAVCDIAGIEQFVGDNEKPAIQLAYFAWQATQRVGFPVLHPDAEAESMIRTGWSP